LPEGIQMGKAGEVKFEAKVEWQAGSPLLAANKK
jgi:hypothetical protein